jgi:hypothetical protein
MLMSEVVRSTFSSAETLGDAAAISRDGNGWFSDGNVFADEPCDGPWCFGTSETQVVSEMC